jgi:hypothetical protein
MSDDLKLMTVKMLPFAGTKKQAKAKDLDDKKYLQPEDWLVKRKAYFRQLGLTGLLEGTLVLHDNPSNEEEIAHNERVDKLEGIAQNFLFQSCVGQPLNYIQTSKESAKEMWETLKDAYEPKNVTNLMKLRGELFQTKLKSDYEDPLDWIARLEIIIKARIEKHPEGVVTETDMIAHVGTSLPGHLYESERKKILEGEVYETFNEVKKAIGDHYREYFAPKVESYNKRKGDKRGKCRNKDDGDVALATTDRKPGGKKRYKPFTGNCRNCGDTRSKSAQS